MMGEHPLRDLLRRYSLAYQPSGPPLAIGNAGGLSGARLWKISAPRGEFVLRLWPESETDVERLRRRLAWVLLLEDLSYVPQPVPALDGQTLQIAPGRFWHLESWKSGSPDSARPPRDPHIRAGMQGLARVHRVWERHVFSGTSPGLQRRWGEVSALRSGAFSTLRDAVIRSPVTPERSVALAWLSESPELLQSIQRQLAAFGETIVALQPTLRDVRSEHLLFSGDQLTGLVDFGALDVDSPASDLARLMADWFAPDDPLRKTALSAYEEVRPLDSRTISLIPLFEQTADLLIGARWIRWHFLDQRIFENPEAPRKGLEIGLNRLRRRLAWKSERSITIG